MISALRNILRQLSRSVRRFPHPRGLRCGPGTFIERPRHISGATRISVGARTQIGAHAKIAVITEYAGETFSPAVTIGDDVYIGPHLYLISASSVTICNGAVLSESVFIFDVSHGMSPDDGLIMSQRLVPGAPVVIGEHAFVGLRASILPGVSLGRHCIVGANAVVTRSVPDYCLVVGNPARVVKRYDPLLKIWARVQEAE